MSAAMLPPSIDEVVAEWIKHDIPSFDVGGHVVGTGQNTAVFYAKSTMVTAGYPFVEAIFRYCGCQVSWKVQEGTYIRASGKDRVVLGEVTGPVNRILQGERTALEVMTRCSSVAYQMHLASTVAKQQGWSGKIAGTRKTTPGTFRLVDKYGLLVGGGDPHRYSLSAMTMLKDNHVDAAGSITAAVKGAKAVGGFSMKVEVEARNVAEATEACAAGADVVMLDNFTPAQLEVEAPALKQVYPNVIFEVSGGITHETLRTFLVEGVDILSMGCLTHGPPAVDVSLKIKKSALVAKM
eukprot:TRINITY_DN35091_c0_g2_i1.p1 TRINITY_DN35091_c0_g2~~TRINITY_DN35091_c0_g2_i1.p1  ORF type:complete len:295 (+),score=139.38 TRINITY_DN35091_c0_g2_i1:63-947(+)